MENEIRRTLDELVARYELEPDLRDIYVEGKTDKLFLEWFLRNRGIEDIAVYEIETVDISADKLFEPQLKDNKWFLINRSIEDIAVYEIETVDISAERLFELQLKDNNRSRVITLALYLQDKFPETTPHVICIADKDFDWLFDITYQCDLLFFTDYSCLEMYLFNETVLNKVLLLSLRISELTAIDILNQLSKVLEDLFLIRAAKESLNINIAMLDNNFGKCCYWNKAKTEFQFDIEKYIDKYLDKCAMRLEKSIFVAKIEELRIKAKELEDTRYKIHGHDFTELLYLYIKDFLRRELKSYNAEILAGTLLGSIDAEELSKETMFQSLLIRLTE
ncbi:MULTISPECIES: DUF4435 domain-containing protein [Nostocales]|uniref:DUF4435 domain-containing protein n=1 Tax=Dolichospermum flos-aquae UHCC 0037 TaxID=2590026 RepID=A0ACC7S404_DOLFA|nr:MULTISPECIES: DUF4435 domain-containing protein [Nostocales]MBO1067620.1 hypothetical protein [Anabaena sp. 54]MTJ42926.1 DUF4435 domain-containing protein [Dolichospermum flos-aquae UHCC 0037]